MKKNYIIATLALVSIGVFYTKSPLILFKNQDKISPNESQSSVGLASDEKSRPLVSTELFQKTPSDKRQQINKTPTTEAFEKKLRAFVKKEFFMISGESEKAKNLKMIQAKDFWISNHLENNETWYRMDFNDELSTSKITIFFNYFKCESLHPKTSLVEKCFSLYVFNFRSDNWFGVSTVSRQDNIWWRNNTAYAQVRLDNLGDFTRHTGAWYLMIPMPRDSMMIYYVKQEDNKFSLEKGIESDWVLTSEKEYKDFLKWAHAFKVKHGETPE